MEKLKNKATSLLRWSEKYTKTDMVYLAKGGSWLALGQIVSTLSSFIVIVIFANLLPPESYGIYKYILSIAGVLTISTLSGINISTIQTVARGTENFFARALKTKIRWGFIGGVVGILIAGYYFINKNSVLGIAMVLVAMFVPFMDSFGLYDSLLQGRKDFRRSSLYLSFSQLIYTTATVIAVTATKNILIILLVYFGTWTITRLIILKKISETIHLNNSERQAENNLSESISYGKHLSLMDVVTSVYAYLDKLIVFHFLGAVNLAIYSFAVAPIDQLRNINKILNKLAFPKFSGRDYLEIKQGLLPKVLFLSSLMALLMLVYILIAPHLYSIIFPQYSESVPYSRIYSIILILIPSTLFGQAITAHARKRELYIAKSATSILGIISILILLPIYGLWGAIAASLLTKLANAIIVLCLFYLGEKSN